MVWEILMILSVTLTLSVGEEIPDLTVAFQQYVSACTSSRLCSTSWNVSPPLKSNVTLPAACPQCDCDKSCVLRGTCCPDILFSGKAIPKCVDVTVIGDGSVQYFMVPSCNKQDSCEEQPFDARIKYTPVSSLETFYSYQTKEVAEKYENPDSLRQWGVEFICNSSVDINFISDYSKLLETVKGEDCRVMYTPNNLVQAKKCSPQVNTVSLCNTTGLWETYDPGVDWACSNLFHQSGLFENIFCRLCNPSRTSQSEVSLISVCNETGLWRNFNKEIEEACTLGQKSHVTYPFKNIFCRICNTNSEKQMLYKEVKGFISESIGEHGYIYHVNMTAFTEEEVTKLKQMFEADTVSRSYSNMIWRDGQWKNKSNLITQYQAITGGSKCNQTIVYSCICDPSCFEDLSKNCCIDFLLEYIMDSPVFKYVKNTSLQSLVTISSCNVKNVFTTKCLNPSDDFMGSFPVTDLSKNLHFRSVYCFLCNQRNISDFTSIENVVPWNITINSSEILDIQFYTSVMDITKIVHLSKHDVILSPRISLWPKRPESGLEKRTCNSTGKWKTLDTDISWACTSFYLPFETYYNAFCKICNPSVGSPSQFKICNVTRRWDLLDNDIRSACASFPEMSASFPFKNQFCKFCNFPSSTYLEIIVQPTKQTPHASLRDIFSVFSVSEREETKACSQFHFRDVRDTCREMRCYPGKILTKDGCIPLLPITRNLNYTVYFSASILNNFTGKAVAENLMSELFNVIKSITNASNFIYHSKAKELTINGNTTIDIEINFFVKDMIQRLESEKSLLELWEKPMKYLQKENPFYSDILYFLTPNKTNFDNQTNLLAEKNEPQNVSQNERPYRNVIIAPIILCEQVELNEFEIDSSDKSRKLIRIIQSDVTLEESDYYITENHSYAVCLDVICADSNCEAMVSEIKESALQEALRIFTIVCTVPSLLCLILTFTHYCLFKKLRTLPGIHVMSLTVSLFFSQFFFQFFLRKDFQGDAGCQIVGMVIHYWWMVMFCCYGLNGYLMLMAFRGSFTFRSDDRRVNKKHFAFSYGLPLAIVLLTIIINSAASGDTGYGLNSICFLNNKVSLIVTFVLVIGIICLWNIVVFCVVVYKLRKYQLQQLELGIDQAGKGMFSTFVKLFTISGISWIFFLVDAFIPEITIFSFIVTFVNCLQGVLLFCLEVCSKKSRDMYKNFRESRQRTRPRQSFSQNRRSVLDEARRRTIRDRSDSSEYDNSAFSSFNDDNSTTITSTT
ncbi:uncharacterized protein LOC133181772 [Saccostrea echinata]|uniref:uncharacterized protein LOC133181772 n=1 Tax=Saccostrea echinata TaxID=191078 RepID=UPI002A80081A|nr:uncharacterized protein LOC133181772 [Saccostrea echinata]